MMQIATEQSASLKNGQRLALSLIPFQEWRAGIAPLWHMQAVYERIPAIINGHGQMRFCGREPYNRVLLFPVAASLHGARVGWTSVYNISDTALRIRGIYVLSEHRALGIGRTMVDFACSLWPDAFTRVFMYARESNVDRYVAWGFKPCPGFTPRTFEGGWYSEDRRVLLMVRNRESA